MPGALALPLRWKKPRRIFVNSMSDLFHHDVPADYIDQVFAVMALAHWHTFQVLTKRPVAMRKYLTHTRGPDNVLTRVLSQAQEIEKPRGYVHQEGLGWPYRNVCLGGSVEDQRAAAERIPELLATPAALRFLSCEPLLGPVNVCAVPDGKTRPAEFSARYTPLGDLDWVIVGGESGPGARPCNVAWVRDLVGSCMEAGVPAFVKQLGAHVQDRNDAGFDGDGPGAWPETTDMVEHDHYDTGYQGAPVRVRLADRAGRDPAEWPEDLRVQRFPEVTRG